MFSLIPRLLVIVFLFILPASGNTQHGGVKKDLLLQQIDSLMQHQIDDGNLPGGVVYITDRSGVIINKAYGYAHLNDFYNTPLPNPVAMRPAHVFDLASLTKVIGTTTSIMILHERGKLHVNDRVGKYVPAFASGEKSNITIRHLLQHSSGLYEWYPMYYKAGSRQEVYDLIGKLPLKYPVGKERHYSDLGFTILAEIIEKVSGLPPDRFQQQNIFHPLGMTKTGYNPLQHLAKDEIAATSHGNPYEYRMVHDTSLGMMASGIDPDSWNGWRQYTLAGEVNDGNAWYAGQGISGAAGLFAPAEDLQKLTTMLLNKGRVNGKRFLRKKTIRKFLRKDEYKNGLGWMMDQETGFMKNAPRGSFGHTGFTGTSIVAIPKKHAAVILLINRQNTGLRNGAYFNVNNLRVEILKSTLKYLE